MKLIWHLVAYDFRVVWKHALAVVALQITYSILLMQNKLRAEYMTIPIVVLTAGWVSVIALLAEAYPAFTANAFWPTRPISTAHIFASRLCSSLVIAILPVALVNCILLLSFGSTIDVSLDNGLMLIWKLVCTTPILLFLSILAGKFSRLILISFFNIIGLGVFIAFLYPLLPYADETLIETRYLLFTFIAIPSCTILIYHAWGRRSRLLSLIYASVLAFIIAGIFIWWPWKFSVLERKTKFAETSAPARLTLNASADQSYKPSTRRNKKTRLSINGIINVPATALDGPTRLAKLEGVLSNDETPHTNYSLNTQQNSLHMIENSLNALLGEGTYIAIRPNPRFNSSINPAAISAKTFTGTVEVERLNPELVAEIPLRNKEQLKQATVRFVIDEVFLQGRTVSLNLTIQKPTRKLSEFTSLEKALENGLMVIINRRLRQAIWLRPQDLKKSTSVNIPGLQRQKASLELYLPNQLEPDGQTWLTDASLCIIGLPAENFFKVPVHFELSAPASK